MVDLAEFPETVKAVKAAMGVVETEDDLRRKREAKANGRSDASVRIENILRRKVAALPDEGKFIMFLVARLMWENVQWAGQILDEIEDEVTKPGFLEDYKGDPYIIGMLWGFRVTTEDATR